MLSSHFESHIAMIELSPRISPKYTASSPEGHTPARSPSGLRAVALVLGATVAALAFIAYHLDSAAARASAQLALAESTAEQAKADLGTANARSAGLQLQVESARSQAADLKAQLDKAQARQSVLQSQLEGALADLRLQADNAKAREAQLQADIQARIKASSDASSGLLKELDQAKGHAQDLKARLAKAQGDLVKLQPLAAKARIAPLEASFEKGFWDRGFTLHVKNLNPDPLSVSIRIAGLGTAFTKSATIDGGGLLNIGNVAAGMQVSIDSAGYDTLTVTAQ